MGRPRKIKSVKALEDAWEEYKGFCDNQMALSHEFSAKNSEFVSAELKRSITYTIEGFVKILFCQFHSVTVAFGKFEFCKTLTCKDIVYLADAYNIITITF
jgi:hypothetical protein